MSVEIRAHPKFSSRIDRLRLKRIVQKTVRGEKAPASLTIYITTDAEMHKLNRAFHGTDAPTDVLSFPMDDGGDIAISYDTAKRQARDAWLAHRRRNRFARSARHSAPAWLR